MQRGETGKYQVRNYGDEMAHAFIPAPLPPDPPLSMDGDLQQLLERALIRDFPYWESSGSRGSPNEMVAS